MLTKDELEEIKARAEAVTPGSLYLNLSPHEDGGVRLCDKTVCDKANHAIIYAASNWPLGTETGDRDVSNLMFFINARQDIPALLDHITELEAESASDAAFNAEIQAMETNLRAEVERLKAQIGLQNIHIAKLGEQYNSAIDWGNSLRGRLSKYEPYRTHPHR